ncbi:HAD family hydrolase [Streptococcus cameli]
MAVEAIIFDMDGVLFETEDFYYHRRKQFLSQKGISIDHIPPAFFVGGRADQIWPEILGDSYENWDIPTLEVAYNSYKEKHGAPYATCLFPDVKETLQQLKGKGIKIALASNTDRNDIERALDEAGIRSYFDAIFSATECRACKPDPEVYERAWESLGVAKEETVIIEDSEKGIEAGKAAGIRVWAIEDKHYGVNQSKADRLLSNLSSLLDFLA